jgi:hypothetical protein
MNMVWYTALKKTSKKLVEDRVMVFCSQMAQTMGTLLLDSVAQNLRQVIRKATISTLALTLTSFK